MHEEENARRPLFGGIEGVEPSAPTGPYGESLDYLLRIQSGTLPLLIIPATCFRNAEINGADINHTQYFHSIVGAGDDVCGGTTGRIGKTWMHKSC